MNAASTQGLHGADDLPPLLETRIHERQVDEVGDVTMRGICCRHAALARVLASSDDYFTPYRAMRSATSFHVASSM